MTPSPELGGQRRDQCPSDSALEAQSRLAADAQLLEQLTHANRLPESELVRRPRRSRRA